MDTGCSQSVREDEMDADAQYLRSVQDPKHEMYSLHYGGAVCILDIDEGRRRRVDGYGRCRAQLNDEGFRLQGKAMCRVLCQCAGAYRQTHLS